MYNISAASKGGIPRYIQTPNHYIKSIHLVNRLIHSCNHTACSATWNWCVLYGRTVVLSWYNVTINYSLWLILGDMRIKICSSLTRIYKTIENYINFYGISSRLDKHGLLILYRSRSTSLLFVMFTTYGCFRCNFFVFCTASPGFYENGPIKVAMSS